GQERGQRSEDVPEVDVLAARMRHERGELRVAERARDRDEAVKKPEEHDHARMADVLLHEAGGAEDAGADHAREHGEGRRPESEPALEFVGHFNFLRSLGSGRRAGRPSIQVRYASAIWPVRAISRMPNSENMRITLVICRFEPLTSTRSESSPISAT